jgi:hypothetical protein
MLGYSLKVNPVQDINRYGALGVEEDERSKKSLANV